MLWIKRNLFLALFGLVAAGLLGVGLFVLWSGVGKNKTLEEQLQQTKQQLDGFYRPDRRDPFPNRTNIENAKVELARVQAAVGQAKQHFTPVPFQPLTNDSDFGRLLKNVLAEMLRKAEQASVALPKKDYAFTFEVHKGLLQFASGSVPLLVEQLAEIKAVSQILFDTKVNRLINLRRMRISTDDPANSTDIHDLKPVAYERAGMVANPYELTFHSFSAELAAVLQAFQRSEHGFLVKSIAIEPVAASDTGVLINTNAPPPPVIMPGPVPPGAVRPPPGGGVPPRPGVPGTTARAPAVPAQRDTMQVILNEKLLKVTLLVEVLKPAPPSPGTTPGARGTPVAAATYPQ